MRGAKVAALLAALVMVVAACGDDDSGVTVDGIWARTSPQMAANGAAYMKITAPSDDALVGAVVSSDIADHAEVHEVVMDDEGQMMMGEVERIPLPAGDEVSLQPGGYHVMFIDLAAPFEMGQTFDLTLQFENADDMTVEVEVTEEDPNG